MLIKEKINHLLKYQTWRNSHMNEEVTSKKRKLQYYISIIGRSILFCNCIYSNPKVESYDILILLGDARLIPRLQGFAQLLRKKKYSVSFETIPTPYNAIKNRMLSKPEKNIPLQLKFFAAFSKYLCQKYQPKILITLMDTSIFSPFLRGEMKKYGKYINIAHGYTANTWKFSMTDFDYYFIFGKKSFANIKNCNVRYGTTNIILTGSIFIGKNFILPLIEPNKNILFFSSWVNNEYKNIIFRNFEIVFDWIKNNPDYNLFIKLHPLEDTNYWADKSKYIKNIFVLDKNINIKDSLSNISLSIIFMSSASIESALLNRPFVIVNDTDIPDDFLGAENFLLPRAKSAQDLDDRINKIFDNYQEYLKKCEEYTTYHLDKKQGSQEYIVELIEKILNNQNIPSSTLPENIQSLINVRNQRNN